LATATETLADGVAAANVLVKSIKSTYENSRDTPGNYERSGTHGPFSSYGSSDYGSSDYGSSDEDEYEDQELFERLMEAFGVVKKDIKDRIGLHAVAAVLGGQVVYGLSFAVAAAHVLIRDIQWILDSVEEGEDVASEWIGEVEELLRDILVQVMIAAKPALTPPGAAWMRPWCVSALKTLKEAGQEADGDDEEEAELWDDAAEMVHGALEVL